MGPRKFSVHFVNLTAMERIANLTAMSQELDDLAEITHGATNGAAEAVPECHGWYGNKCGSWLAAENGDKNGSWRDASNGSWWDNEDYGDDNEYYGTEYDNDSWPDDVVATNGATDAANINMEGVVIGAPSGPSSRPRPSSRASSGPSYGAIGAVNANVPSSPLSPMSPLSEEEAVVDGSEQRKAFTEILNTVIRKEAVRIVKIGKLVKQIADIAPTSTPTCMGKGKKQGRRQNKRKRNYDEFLTTFIRNEVRRLADLDDDDVDTAPTATSTGMGKGKKQSRRQNKRKRCRRPRRLPRSRQEEDEWI